MDDVRDVKQEAHKLVDRLPDDASWDDLMYDIYVRQAIDAGLEDVQQGRVLSHEEAVARIRPTR
jgi:hypothetical protein